MPDSNNAYLPVPQYKQKSNPDIKIAIPDLLVEDPNMSIDTMTDYVFAEIGGQEILSTSRHDLIDSPLSENNKISDAGSAYRRTKYIEPSDGIANNFRSFQVNINDHIPESISDVIRLAGLSEEADIVEKKDNIFVESDGSIHIVLKNLKSNYKVEVEFLTIEDLVDGTIY